MLDATDAVVPHATINLRNHGTGQISALSVNPRIMQFGLKVEF